MSEGERREEKKSLKMNRIVNSVLSVSSCLTRRDPKPRGRKRTKKGFIVSVHRPLDGGGRKKRRG